MRDFEPQVKPPWWNDTHHCEYHRRKGHRSNDCLRLKNLVQDLLDKGDITVDGHKTNDDHVAFRNPLLNYDKGASSSSNKKGPHINHVYNNIINHISAYGNHINVIKIKDKQEQVPVNVTTGAQSKYVLKGNTSKAPTPPKE